MRSTKREIRKFYDQSPQYEAFQKVEGWITPRLLIKYAHPYLLGNERIIDVGCGPGLVGEELCGSGWRGRLVGVDISGGRLREAKEKSIYTECVVADADHLPFVDCSFDVVFSNAMVGLTGNQSVKEMYRLVKPGGYFACVAGEIKSLSWCRKRFRGTLLCFEDLSRARCLLRKDLGTGYINTDYDDEHYICLIYKKL